MSVPCKNSLTNRELNIVYQNISTKFVDKLCDQIIDYNIVSGKFSEILQNKMIEVLGKAETQGRMADAILQSIGTTLRHSTTGPYLLYALLNNTASFPKVEEVMNKVFTDIYKDGDNKYVFVKRLARVLHEPHPGLFITQKGGGGRTYKRRKTSVRLSRSTDKPKRKTRSVRGETKQRGGAGPAGGDVVAAALSSAAEGADPAGGDAVAAALSSAAGGAGAKEALIEAAAGVAAGAAVTAGTDLLKAGAGGGAVPKAGAGAGAGAIATSNVVNRSLKGATNSGLIANELYSGYEKALVDNVTKNLKTTSSIISTKMVNASYIYMLKNGQTIMDAVRSNIETSLSNQSSSYDVNKIIIIQALFSAIHELTRSIHTIANKRAKISPGFDPLSTNFISEVIRELLQNIQRELKIT